MNIAILLSPSEGKVLPSNYEDILQMQNLDFLESLWCNHVLNTHRTHLYTLYLHTIKNILEHNDKELLAQIYGTKNFNAKNEFELNCILAKHALLPAIQRYNGVAFDGLDFSSLSEKEKQFILQHVFIFSNLFGIIRASDTIPFYKLKQGCKIQDLTLKKVYSPFLSILDSLKSWEYIIDLRAGIYTKIFIPKQPHFFFEFQKNGKTISHYAKLYRGKILQIIAKHARELNYNQMLTFLQDIHTDIFAFQKISTHNNTITIHYEIIN